MGAAARVVLVLEERRRRRRGRRRRPQGGRGGSCVPRCRVETPPRKAAPRALRVSGGQTPSTQLGSGRVRDRAGRWITSPPVLGDADVHIRPTPADPLDLLSHSLDPPPTLQRPPNAPHALHFPLPAAPPHPTKTWTISTPPSSAHHPSLHPRADKARPSRDLHLPPGTPAIIVCVTAVAWAGG